MKQVDSKPVANTPGFTEPIRIAICESTSIACELLRTALSRVRTFQVVACVTESQSVVEALTHRPDVMLISARLADGPIAGFRALLVARENSPSTRCVILVEDWSAELVVDAFRRGAAGVFYRGDNFQHLCRCLSVVHEGQIWAGTTALKHLINALAHVAPINLVNAKGDELLTQRELQVVSLVAEGLSNREISQQLRLSEHTIKNHIYHIFEKLGVSSRVELALYLTSQRERRVA